MWWLLWLWRWIDPVIKALDGIVDLLGIWSHQQGTHPTWVALTLEETPPGSLGRKKNQVKNVICCVAQQLCARIVSALFYYWFHDRYSKCQIDHLPRVASLVPGPHMIAGVSVAGCFQWDVTLTRKRKIHRLIYSQGRCKSCCHKVQTNEACMHIYT